MQEPRNTQAGAEPQCVTPSPTDAPAPSSSGKVSRVLTRLPGALPLVVRGLVLLGLLAGLAWVPLTGPPHLLSRAASPAPGAVGRGGGVCSRIASLTSQQHCD